MRPFLQDRRRRFEALLIASTAALQAYTDHDLDLATVVVRFLERVAEEYRSLGLAVGENEVTALKAQFASARDGVDPVSGQRPAVKRREMERSVALRVLLLAAERLRTDLVATDAILANARDQLAPLIVYALGKGMVVPGPDGTLTQADIELLWQQLLDDPEAGAVARRVALDVAAVDVIVLLADLLGSLA